MNIKINPGNSLAIVLIIATLVLLSSCKEQTAVLVKDSSTSIAIERTGLDGEYDPSGLAKRVAQALEEDFILSGISQVYVAQNNRKIILKGTISERNFLDRLVTIAQNVQGSNKTRQNWTGFLLVRVVTYSLRGTNRPLLIFLY